MKECAKYALQAYETHLTFKTTRQQILRYDDVFCYVISFIL